MYLAVPTAVSKASVFSIGLECATGTCSHSHSHSCSALPKYFITSPWSRCSLSFSLLRYLSFSLHLSISTSPSRPISLSVPFTPAQETLRCYVILYTLSYCCNNISTMLPLHFVVSRARNQFPITCTAVGSIYPGNSKVSGLPGLFRRFVEERCALRAINSSVGAPEGLSEPRDTKTAALAAPI